MKFTITTGPPCPYQTFETVKVGEMFDIDGEAYIKAESYGTANGNAVRLSGYDSGLPHICNWRPVQIVTNIRSSYTISTSG